MEKDILAAYQQLDLPLFNQPFWLDVVTDGHWNLLTAFDKKNQLASFLPIHTRRYKIFNLIINPALTPFVRFCFLYPDNLKPSKQTGWLYTAQKQIIDQLPHYDYFDIHLDFTYTNWLPFYWNDFFQTTRYSYIINKNTKAENLLLLLRENIRRQVKKAMQNVEVVELNDPEMFYDVIKDTYRRQQKKNPYDKELISNVFKTCKEQNCGKISAAVDAKKNIHAAVFIGKDYEFHHYLAGGSFSAYRNSGALSLLLYTAAKDALKEKKHFNFEGSMMENIEYFFRSFGSRQMTYSRLVKYSGLPVKIALSLKNKPLIWR